MELNTDYQIYLDNAATTPVDPIVINAMLPFFNKKFGNPSSIHSVGQEGWVAVEESRAKIAKFLNCNPKEIIFTASGTESDNMAIIGVARRLKFYGNHIITSNIEHSAVRNALNYLKNEGFEITEIPVDKQGIVHVNDISTSIRLNTILISIMWVNNEIGTIQPIEEIAELAYSKNIIFHTDAVQAFGKIRIDLSKIKVNLLSASAHKIYGPKGVGLLFIRDGGHHKKYNSIIEPLIYGGGQEFGLRSATENVPGIVGFGVAVELADKCLEIELHRETQLRDDFIQWIFNNIEDSYLNGHPLKRISSNINLTFRNTEGEAILLRLDEKNVAISTGSACLSHESKQSHVIKALGLNDKDKQGTIRITIGRQTSIEDLNIVKKLLKEIVFDLRK